MHSSINLAIFTAFLLARVSVQSIISCYDCNSDVRSRNPNCPSSGITKSPNPTVGCRELCFTRTHMWEPTAIFRGCTSGLYLTRPLPFSGCMLDAQGDTWCFCHANKCNTMAMSPREKI